MATGYTGKLVEEGQSFKDFVMTCARAFGPFIEMRDKPLDAPIPDSFDGGGSYHKESIHRAQERVKQLKRMNKKEREAYGEERKSCAILSYESAIEETKVQIQRVEEMEQKVQDWNPPVAYAGLKTFMLSQLRISKDSPDSLIRLLDAVKESNPMDYWSLEVNDSMRDVRYHRQELVEAKKIAKNNTKWVRNLQKLLKKGE